MIENRICILCLFLLLIPATVFAQQTKTVCGQTHVVSVGSEAAEVLPYTNVMVVNADDSTLVKGMVSDKDGRFNIRFTPQKEKKYLLKASYIGMTTLFCPLNTKPSTIDLGNVLLKEGIELSTVTVTAQAKDIDQVGDTTVINASAYKTPEGSNLEALVKRIPGMDYDPKNKSLTYNGVPISAINVNGEAFFEGNNSMALENLPVELISKIKVYDKKTELEKVTGVRSGQENYVLDLQTKREFNGTLMASGEAGAGNYNKKDLSLMGNYFKQGGDNATLMARSGNRNMTTRYKDNIQNLVGMNFTKKIGKELTINASATLNGLRSGNQSTAYNEQYLSIGNQYQLSANESRNENRNLSSQFGLRWQLDKKTYFNFSGNLNHSTGENTTNNRKVLFDAYPDPDLSDPFAYADQWTDDMKMNDITLGALSSNTQNNYSLHGNLTRILNERGSSISLTTQYSEGNGDNENFSVSTTTYYRLKDIAGNDSILHRNQYQLTPSTNQNSNVGLMYTHVFTKELRLQLSYNLGYNTQQSDRSTYDLSALTAEDDGPGLLPPGYEAHYTDSLSNCSHSFTFSQALALRMNFSNKTWDLHAGVSVNPERRNLDQKTGLLQADTITRTVGLQPSFNLSWKKEKTTIRFNYNGNTRQPSISDLLSLTDNSDPLNITRGNPDLRPAYSQNFRLEIRDTKRGLFATANFQNEFNSTTRAVIYNQQTGGRESYPVNINGNWRTNATLRYEKRLKKFKISTDAGGGYSSNVGLINEGQTEQPERSTTGNTSLNSNLRLSYLPLWGSFDLSGDWHFQHSSNSLRQAENYTRNYTLGLNAYSDLPGGLQLKSDVLYSFRNGTNIKKGEEDQLVWNAGITWRFLKKKQAELSGYWADILSKKKNYIRYTTSNGFNETHTQQIGSYFLVSLRYRFNHTL